MNNRSIKKYRSEYDYPGLYRARVVDVDIEINDEGPNGYGAIKVFIPDVHTDVDENRNEFSDGIDAYPANSLTGAYNNEDELGETHYYQSSVYIPPKGSMVWVFFENGNVSKNCYYLTGFRCELAKLPPENIDGDEPHKITTVYKSNQGRAIVVSDDNRNSRVEITGKKRNLSNPPEGDKKSVYDIDGNQTTILLEEINGEEKLLIKSHRGDFINFNIERQELHIDFQGDIITKSSGDLFVDVQGNINYSTNQDFNIRTMGNFNLSSQGNMNINSASNFSINTQGLGTIDASLLMNQSKAGQGPPVIPPIKKPEGERTSSFGSLSTGISSLDKQIPQEIDSINQQLNDIKEQMPEEIGDINQQLDDIKEEIPEEFEEATEQIENAKEQLDDVKDQVTEQMENATKKLNDVKGQVTDEIENVTKQVSDQLGNVKKQVTDQLGNVTEQIGNATEQITKPIGNVTEKLGNVTEQVSGMATKVPKQIGSSIDQLSGIKKFNNVTHLDTITDQDKIEAERGSTLTEFLGNINPGNNINDFLSQVSDDQISEVDV